MTVAAWHRLPESTGFVKDLTADPLKAPEIKPNYLSEKMDQTVFVAGLLLIRKIISTKYMQPYCGGRFIQR